MFCNKMPVIWSCTKWDDVIIEFLEQKSWHFPLSHMWAPAGWTQFSGALRQTDRLLWYSGLGLLVGCLAWTFGVIRFFRGSSLPCTFGAAAACACRCFPSSLPAAIPILTCSFFFSFVLHLCVFILTVSWVSALSEGWQVFSPLPFVFWCS